MYSVEAIYLSHPQINGDPAAQAAMLHALGLLRGTGEGFALDRTMTRAEAAAMLTRLLGAEAEAQASVYPHPFTDVPAWAAPYAGYLYQYGLTKGVSATCYGADEPVTALQFATFLSRAVAGNDEYVKNGVLDENEASNAQYPAPCTRAMAVSLSVRVLTLPCTADGADGRTLAQRLLAQDVFSAAQFTEAAWDVLPPQFAAEPNGDLVVTIAGIEGARNTDGLRLDTDSTARRDQGTLYAYAQKNGKTTVYAVNPQTLRATALGTRRYTETPRYLGTMNGRDYLFEENGALLSCDGKTLGEVLPAAVLTKNGFSPKVRISNDYIDLTAITVTAPDGIYLIRANSEAPLLLDCGSDTKIAAQSESDNMLTYLITGPENGHSGSLRCFDLVTGEQCNSQSVGSDMDWAKTDRFLYGPHGLYRVIEDFFWVDDAQTEYDVRPLLKFWTPLPVYGVQTVRWGAAVSDPYVLTGKNGPERLLLLRSGGTVEEQIVFARFGLTDVTMEGEFDGYDGAPHFFARNGEDPGMYAYVAADSWLSVHSYTPDSGTADDDVMCAAEQARLEKLGNGG